MRIINLVNISTVLLLINLLQTKSQGNGEQHETVLKVTINAQVKHRSKNVRVKWTRNFQNPLNPEYKKLGNIACILFLEYVKTQIPSGSDNGRCTNPAFKPEHSSQIVGVIMNLPLVFIYSKMPHFNTEELQNKLSNNLKSFKFLSSLEITDAEFHLEIVKYLASISVPQTTPPPNTPDNNAISVRGSEHCNYWRRYNCIRQMLLMFSYITFF
uniref:SJCHGC09328 protein n=1 Tax=Schistosoma japonicum TaxID=6182 RepID=Q5DDC6_SCHJA|nr:SJCHGC09328 protein [Schistosoma japonicum]